MNNISKKVKNIIKKYKTRDPEEISKKMGINVQYNSYDDLTKGYYINIKRNKYITLNSNLNEYEKKIVLAHELGHAALHSSKNIHFIREFTLFPTGVIEKEANKFAAELLICDDILENYPDYYTVDQIASCENVYKELLILKFNLKI